MPRCKTRACHTSYRSFECLFLTESAAKYDPQRVDKMNVPPALMKKKKKMKERKENEEEKICTVKKLLTLRPLSQGLRYNLYKLIF